MNNFEVTSESTSGAPTITFAFKGDTFSAFLAGASLYGEYEGDDKLRIRLNDADGELLADVTAHPRNHRNTTENAIDIGSALLWSHWRYVEASSIAAAAEAARSEPLPEGQHDPRGDHRE